ncbi:hypothetical protein Tco_1133063 [Tanacetum coccineum]|uniref:Uncharacterized protein n=1 Tax=Tanacetum coccineum TaxID=301880 RepID=A0ABQ5JGE9_9ASTR
MGVLNNAIGINGFDWKCGALTNKCCDLGELMQMDLLDFNSSDFGEKCGAQRYNCGGVLASQESIVGSKLWSLDDITSKVVLYRNIGFEFEVEPYGNFDYVDGSQEVQTQDLMDYQLARDTEQHLVAKAEKIDAHESLNFNDTVTCIVIFKWKARLKEEMNTWPDVYVLSKCCRKVVTTEIAITGSMN